MHRCNRPNGNAVLPDEVLQIYPHIGFVAATAAGAGSFDTAWFGVVRLCRCRLIMGSLGFLQYAGYHHFRLVSTVLTLAYLFDVFYGGVFVKADEGFASLYRCHDQFTAVFGLRKVGQRVFGIR